MLFKILKLLGLDVPAKMAAAKSEIEQRVEEVMEYAKQATQTAATIAGLSAAAGVLVGIAVGIGLYALYRVVTESYGVNAGLGVVVALLVAATLILLLIARTKGEALSNRRIFKPSSPLSTSAGSAPTSPAAPVQAPMSAAFAAAPDESAGDLVEPLAFLLAKYVKFPALGHPVLDELVGNLRTSARGTAEEAVERAANLIRQGDRTQLLIMLGGAAIVGWLLARQNPHATLRDITPAE
jgi:hypothetical protein